MSHVSSDPFRGAKSRLARGRELIGYLRAGMKAYHESEPFELLDTLNDESGLREYRIRITNAVPQACTDLAAEAMEALRSSLDQLGYAAAKMTAKGEPKHAHFPFGDTEQAAANVAKGRSKDVPPEVVAIFLAHRPYLGGNNHLDTSKNLAVLAHF